MLCTDSHGSQVSLSASITTNDQEAVAGVWNMSSERIFREPGRIRKEELRGNKRGREQQNEKMKETQRQQQTESEKERRGCWFPEI